MHLHICYGMKSNKRVADQDYNGNLASDGMHGGKASKTIMMWYIVQIAMIEIHESG